MQTGHYEVKEYRISTTNGMAERTNTMNHLHHTGVDMVKDMVYFGESQGIRYQWGSILCHQRDTKVNGIVVKKNPNILLAVPLPVDCNLVEALGVIAIAETQVKSCVGKNREFHDIQSALNSWSWNGDILDNLTKGSEVTKAVTDIVMALGENGTEYETIAQVTGKTVREVKAILVPDSGIENYEC